MYTRVESVLAAFEVGELIYMSAYDILKEPSTLELVHHAAGLLAEGGCLYFSSGVPYMLWVHLAQSTQPFLYLAWVLEKLKLVDTALFAVSSLVCFFLCECIASKGSATHSNTFS